MKYLVRDDSSGLKEVTGEPLDIQGQPLRPWALTSVGDVVYADWKRPGFGLQIFKLGNTRLKTYDKAVSQQRRREFETKLAQDAALHPECSSEAVKEVTRNLLEYVENCKKKNPGAIQEAGAVIKTRCFSNTGSGRLGTVAQSGRKDFTDKDAWKMACDTLNQGGDIPKILGIQTALANVLTRTLGFGGGNREAIYKGTAAKVAPNQGHLYTWFRPGRTEEDRARDGQLRGRQKADPPKATSVRGITKPGVVTAGDGAEERIRGIDSWARVEGSDFVKGIDMRNLVFGAGRSGTTGQLLKTYRTFGKIDDGESFKQYLLAIVVYLVSGGHHTCHEIFSVANLLVGSNGPRAGRPNSSVAALVRDAYVPGKYIKHLPDSYLGTEHFGKLQEKYYDIAMLGHLHGTFV